MNCFKRFVLLTILFIPMIAWADCDIRYTCGRDMLDQESAALAAKDWGKLEQFAYSRIRTCKHVLSDEDYSSAYESIAIVNYEFGNYEKVLAACNKGINIFYSVRH